MAQDRKGKGKKRAARSTRLADALRANLRRRKLQARGRAAEPDKPPPETGAGTTAETDR
jgi:hypothetical protein